MHCDTPKPVKVSHDSPEPSIADALRLWQHVFGDRPDLVELFTGYRKERSKAAKLEMPSWRHYTVGQLEQAWAWAQQQDSINRDTYACAHQLLAPKRTKDNASAVLSLWADVDGADLATSPINPTAVVESSPGRTQAYAKLSAPIAPLRAEKLNKRWALSFGADPSGFDLTQLLRVPGTRNYGYPDAPLVRLLELDEETVYDVDELDKILPPLPEPKNAMAYRSAPLAAVSQDDQELLTHLLERKPSFARAWQGDAAAVKSANPSDVDWMMARDLVEACGLDVDRAEAIMLRCSALQRDKWESPRGDVTYLRHTLEKAAKEPFQNATPYRSDDPSTWPELVAEIPDGPANGKCSDHCKLRHHPKEQALFRQIELINELIQCDLSPVFKLTILRLVALIGFQQSRGNTKFQTSAKKIGEAIGLSAQSVRTVLHALARNDRDELNNEHGLIDLDSTRVPEAGPYCSVFDITPLTDGGYVGFLEAVVAYAPDLPAPPKRAPRQKHEEIMPPPDVVQIRGCPGVGSIHPMHSRPVICADCGDDLIEEVRYTQNTTPYRTRGASPLWSTSDDTPERSDDSPPRFPDYWPVYDRVPS